MTSINPLNHKYIRLGGVLMQDGKPIAYASKSLTQPEVNYAQIHKELYAIIFECKRFRYYIYGRGVRVETDHKPVACYSSKDARILVQLQGYGVDSVYIRGK